MTKAQERELKSVKRIISKFCKANNIKTPTCLVKSLDHSLGEFHRKKPKYIHIDISKCKISTKRVNSSYIKDKTISGVAIHEFAHYIHIGSYYNPLRNRFKRLKEPLIHYFETSIDEDIAESIRLFILNPTLLKEGRPKRYSVLSQFFKEIDVKHFTELFYHLPNDNKHFIDRWINGEC